MRLVRAAKASLHAKFYNLRTGFICLITTIGAAGNKSGEGTKFFMIKAFAYRKVFV